MTQFLSSLDLLALSPFSLPPPLDFSAGAVGSCFFFWSRKTARHASSNTSERIFCVSAEHSMYLYELISLPSFSPCSAEIGLRFCFLRLEMVASLSRRASLVPTKIEGVL